ncbi:PadR family transcriptional regulator [Paenibacillus sp. FSL R7-0273]|uniref:PadR family transcriptional regulator n=1 Tax=Paenibacillus sp. FSL R7-0273 TaxID=1536772 RepID=UPI0004F753C8|nr:helix-turn-helix transcriptional regulator [Paenibacillus sp. FSL R7-0273]AIQ46162.1 PadR family transcriptional regulator [Paenibacillus sp. FSL R7-0273]OMF92715.1 PadR family transcriptional regulator [Paenibacillus sp. FSL R7-0273]
MPDNKDYGALTEGVYYILLSLLTPMHGYGIMQNVKLLSNERVELGAGTLYGALSTLVERGWIELLQGEQDSRKKEYRITEAGRTAVRTEMARLDELLANGKKLMGGEPE